MQHLSCPNCGGQIPANHKKEINCEYCGTLLTFESGYKFPLVNRVPHPGPFPKHTSSVGMQTEELKLWWIHFWLWKKGEQQLYQEYATVAANLRQERHNEGLFGSCPETRNKISRLTYNLIGILGKVAPEDWGYDYNRLPEAPPVEWV